MSILLSKVIKFIITLDEWDLNWKMSEFLDDIEYNQFDNNEMYMNVFPKVNLITHNLLGKFKNRSNIIQLKSSRA